MKRGGRAFDGGKLWWGPLLSLLLLASACSQDAALEPPVVAGAPFDRATDLLVLHYDHAPDLDDAHATVTGRELTEHFVIEPVVVGGSYGSENANFYKPRSEDVMDATWGTDGWLDAHNRLAEALNQSIDSWAATLSSGGDIWIAEGGQSDFTADVVRAIKNRLPDVDTTQRIHVVQHSTWNEDMTTDVDLEYVQAETNYLRLEDGNEENSTANLQGDDNGFSTCALGGQFSSAWQAAFDYYPATVKVDFSDTVELLYILDIGLDQVADTNDYCAVFIQ